MPTIPQRIASAFAVLRGRYGDITQMAKDREQSRQSLYREADRVVEAVDGAATRARIDDLQRQLADQRAEVQALQERLKHAIEITPDTQHEFAAVAQAEGVSLSVARRLLRVVTGSKAPPSVATLGRATLEAGERAGRLLQVLDEAARPAVEQAAADEIFWPPPGPDGGRAREPVLDDRPDGPGARRRHLGGGVCPTPGVEGRGPRRRHRAG
jgi:phage-related tail protein